MTKKTENKESPLKIGVISKTHGIKGHVFIRPFNKISSWPKDLDEILIGENFLSFKVESYTSHKDGFIFKLKNLDHINQSEELKGKIVCLSKDNFLSKKGEFFYLSELLGFHLEVSNKGLIGAITSFQSTKFQDYLLVDTPHSKEPLQIPFVQDYIQDINFLQKKILMNLPEDFPGISND